MVRDLYFIWLTSNLAMFMSRGVVVHGTGFSQPDLSSSSPLFECLELTNVTVLVTSSAIMLEDLNKLMNQLGKNPCFTLFVYHSNIRKAIEWKRGSINSITQFEAENMKYLRSDDTVEFIASLQQQQSQKVNDATTNYSVKNVFLAFFQGSIEILKALETMDSDSAWDVIVVCFGCPISHRIPIHRFVPISLAVSGSGPDHYSYGWIYLPSSIITTVNDLVKNPDFDKLEYLQYVKIDDFLVNCLTNKTVFIFVNSITVKLMENIALLLHNTEGLSTQVILHEHFLSDRWVHFVKHNSKIYRNHLHLVSRSNVIDVMVKMMPQDDDNVYLFAGVTKRYICSKLDEYIYIEGRKNELKSSYLQKCKDFKRVSSDDKHFKDFDKDVIEKAGLLSCLEHSTVTFVDLHK